MAKSNDAQKLLKALHESLSPEQISRQIESLMKQINVDDLGGTLYLMAGAVKRKLKSDPNIKNDKISRIERAFDMIEQTFNDIDNKR